MSRVVGQLDAGASIDELLSDFPYLEPEDILAASEYAVDSTLRLGGRLIGVIGSSARSTPTSVSLSTSENRLAMIDELEGATAKLQDADRAISERTQAMLAKTDLPEGIVQAEYQRLTELAERGEDDPDAPKYFSSRRGE